MKILITGGDGQVGTYLKYICDQQSLLYAALNKTELNITNKQNIYSSIESFNPSIIVNAAAYTNVEKAEEEKFLATAVNATGPKNLAEICDELSIPLIHISTDYVFDGKKGKPYNESDQTNPINTYGKTKLEGENAIRSRLDNHLILRTSWVFSDTSKNFMQTIIGLCKSEKTLKVVGDQYGSPTSARSIAETIISICKDYSLKKEFKPGTYHFSGEDTVTWYLFAKKIIDIALEKKLIMKAPLVKEISTKEYPTVSKKPVNTTLSCAKIFKIFNVEPCNWEEEIHFTVDALKIINSSKLDSIK
jgi:dTDP-4-dehydrorhamnose reductase